MESDPRILTAPIAETPGSSNDSTIWNFTIPAGETYLLSQDGTSFEFTVQTGPVSVRRRNGKFASQYNEFANGTGVRNVTFSSLEIKNLSKTAPVVCQMVVGSANFINNTLNLINGGLGAQQVVNPVYPVAIAAKVIDIPDLSGASFTDINGKKWLAIQRIAIEVFNTDAADVYFLQKFHATSLADGSVGAVQPKTPVRFDFAGDYTIQQAANINAIVNEIYSAIPA